MIAVTAKLNYKYLHVKRNQFIPSRTNTPKLSVDPGQQNLDFLLKVILVLERLYENEPKISGKEKIVLTEIVRRTRIEE